MFATAVIVFREVLEASLIVGIVMAATRGAPRRALWVSAGLVVGLLGAGLMAGFADVIAEAAAGMGQEWFNAVVLFVAVGMLGWHNIWMKQHGRELSQRMNSVGRAVQEGERPLYAVAIVVGVAVLREGAEVVLFLYGIAAGGGSDALSMLSGGAIGLALGAGMGALLYFGLLRIPMRHLFSVTSWMILLLSAGLAAQGAGFLAKAGVLPTVGDMVWDTSSILSERHLFGQLMHTLVGYMARPMGIQLIFYVMTILIIGGLMWLTGRRHTARQRAGMALGMVAGLLLLSAFLAVPAAHASHKVYSPYVDYQEWEFEARGHYTFDGNPALDGARKDKYEVGYGFTRNWFSSVWVEYEQDPGGSYGHSATGWENIFQLTEPGKYWVDSGLYLEYETPAVSGLPDELEAKLLLEKPVGRLVHTANLVFHGETGTGASGDISLGYAWRSKYRMSPAFEPGIEIYGGLGTTSRIETGSSEQQIGPVVAGKFARSEHGYFRYELGYLVGISTPAPTGTAKWLLEYETHF